MYSDKKNILQLVALLKAHSIKHVVLCPGSRNAPIIHSLAQDKDFICHTVVDERSAAFYALGVILACADPVAVCCTSGTAVMNLGSAVAEAYYQQLPLIIITADRPDAWIGQMDGQTLPQPSIFGNLVKKSVHLPEPATSEEEWYCNRLINEALLATNHHGYGPVHINIPISEPLFQFNTPELPTTRKIERCFSSVSIEDDLLECCYANRIMSFQKRMIIIGQTYPWDYIERDVEAFCNKYDCVILAETLSNQIRPGIITNFDALLYSLSEEEKKRLAPELLITVGGHIVSKRLKKFLRSYPPKEHWHVSRNGEIADLFQCVTDVIETSQLDLFFFFTEINRTFHEEGKPYHKLWDHYSRAIPEPHVPFSDLYAIGQLIHSLPKKSALHLGNSSSVRYAQLFQIDKSVKVYCNRGTSGIDGSLSTAVGYAAASEDLTFLIIGDLSFFYDMNGLWNHQLNPRLRILLNNNGGGEIFHALPGLNKAETLDRYIAATHQTSARPWAEAVGFLYLSASNEEELESYLPIFVSSKSDHPIIIEVNSSMDINTEILKDYYHALKRI